MNQQAGAAIEEAWNLTVQVRARCPSADESAVGATRYTSPPWYQARGAAYQVTLAHPLTADDVWALQQMADFVNRGLVITMAAILEAHDIVPHGKTPDLTRPGGKHVQLVKWLRNRFAHGEWRFDPVNAKHLETRELLVELFPSCRSDAGFPVPIDAVLEELKDRVLEYIRTQPR